MDRSKILIVGGTGTIGSEIVRILRQRGHSAVAATSRPAVNDEFVQMDAVTGEGVKQAFSGVGRVFLLSPPGYSDQYALLSPLVQESKRQGLKKVVLMTALGANANEQSPFRRVEVELEKSGLAYNIIRPNWFFQNFHTYWVQSIIEQNQLQLPAGNAKTSFIDTRDIAAVAAELLVGEEFNGQAFDLTGREAYTHTQVAEAISQVAGRSISYRDISPDDFKKTLMTAGLNPEYAEFLTMIMGFLREGYNAVITKDVELILKRAPRDLNDYVNTYKDKWINS